MTYRTFTMLWGLSVALLVSTGCVSESWDYRAVRDVTVSRPYEPGSAGPLVLATGTAKIEAPKADVGRSIDNLTPVQIGMLDPGMHEKLRRQSDLKTELSRLHASYGPSHPKVIEVTAALDAATKDVNEYAAQYRDLQKRTAVSSAAAPSQPLPMSQTPPIQTVLMIAMHKNLAGQANNVGRTFVLVIDGPLSPGQYWLNADNSVLISWGDWSNPARTRVGLNGSVKVLKVTGREVIADVAVRELPEGDISLPISHIWDPNYFQPPWIVTGRRHFILTGQDDPAFIKGQVKWMKLGDEPENAGPGVPEVR